MLEELMDPISAGFLEGQQLIETKMNQVCEDVRGVDNEALKKVGFVLEN